MEAAIDKPTADSGVGAVSDGNPSNGQQAATVDSALTVGETEVKATKAEQKPVNLDDLPEFRKFKSKIDRERARERQLAEERLAQMERQLNQFRQLAEQNLRPDELRALRQSEYESELEKERAARRELEMMIARQSALTEMANRYGVPIDELEDVETPSEAYERILERKTKEYSEMNARLSKLEQEMQARLAAASATPVIGNDITGAGSSTGSLQKQYDEAAMRRDVKKMEEVIALAMREGVKLDKTSVFARKRS